jgi:hypothetical protein
MSGISGPLGPSGTDAVVMTGMFSSVATLASAVAFVRSSATPMSFTVCSRPLW